MHRPVRRAIVLTALPVEYDAVRAYLKCVSEEEDGLGTVWISRGDEHEGEIAADSNVVASICLAG
jgi:hypothetical protein